MRIIHMELKKIEHKPAEWSEEDRQTLRLIIDDLSEELNDEPDEADKEILCRKISFLNSLKPQPIHKWDREDIKIKLEITNYFECQKRDAQSIPLFSSPYSIFALSW